MNTHKTLKKNIQKEATGFRGRPKEFETVISDSAKLRQQIQIGQNLLRQVGIILKCKQCHFRLRPKNFSAHRGQE